MLAAAVFGSERRRQTKRVLYATNFAVLLSTFVSGYIFDRAEVTGVYGFKGAVYLKTWGSLVPMANLLSPLMQQVIGFDNISKSIPTMLLLHAVLLAAQAILQMIGTTKCHTFWMLTYPIINLNYGIIDHWLDQVEVAESSAERAKESEQDAAQPFDQAYRGIGVMLINWPVAI